MTQLIVSAIFIFSISGIIYIILKKIPILSELPENGYHGFKKPEFILNVENKIKENHFRFFTKQVLLQRLLSKLRIIILKIEKRIDIILGGIRKKSQELDKKIKNKK